MDRKRSRILILFLAVLGGMISWCLFTPQGSQFVIAQALRKYVQGSDLIIQESSGNLAQGIVLKGLELSGIKVLPQGSRIKIQDLSASVIPWNLARMDIAIENARVFLPHSDPVVLTGTLKGQELDFNIFSQGFSVNEILGYLPDLKGLIPVDGEIKAVDLYIRGTRQAPKITGNLQIASARYKGFILSESLCRLDISLKGMKRYPQLFGQLVLEGGVLNTPKTLIMLESGKIDFSGLWDQPYFSFKAHASVERTKINIVLKGTIEKPEVCLSSEPSYPREKLMLMLATGKSWQNLDESMETGVLSEDLIKDFVDYLFFAGRGSEFSERFGVHDFTVKFKKDVKGIGAQKDLSDQLEVGYDVEQRTTGDKQNTVTQKFQGEYQVTEEISVGAEREMTQEPKGELLDEESPKITNKDKIYLKYKKSF